MATVDTSLVEDELRRLIRTSQAIKKLTRTILERIEMKPSSFDALKDVPASVRHIKNLVAIRKAKITNPKHDFRLIFAHWKFDDGAEHVDILLAFPRREGYRIDWAWCEKELKPRKD